MEESEDDEFYPRPRGVNVIHMVKERVKQIADLIQVCCFQSEKSFSGRN